MIEHNKGHYLDLGERRNFYKQKLGNPITSDIYNYYINMMDAAIEHRSKDADFNRLKFPFSIGAKQELIKVIMIIQADAKVNAEAEIRASQIIQPKTAKVPKKKLFSRWRKK